MHDKYIRLVAKNEKLSIVTIYRICTMPVFENFRSCVYEFVYHIYRQLIICGYFFIIGRSYTVFSVLTNNASVITNRCHRPISQIPECPCSLSHSAQFRTEWDTFCSEWGIVGYGTGVFCDLGIRSILKTFHMAPQRQSFVKFWALRRQPMSYPRRWIKRLPMMTSSK